MRLILPSWSVVADATILTGVSSFAKGHPPANAVNPDVRRIALARGIVTVGSGVDDAIDFDEGGGELNATVTNTTYLSPMLAMEAAATAMNVVGSNWFGYWAQDGTDRYKAVLERSSGTATLKVANGTNTATSFLKKMGWRPDNNTSTLGKHVADFSVIHDRTTGDVILFDLTTAKTAECAVLINPILSASARPSVRFGSSTAVSANQHEFGDYDDEIMVSWFPSVRNYRYIRLDLLDPYNTDTRTIGGGGGQVGCGYLYVGPYFEPSQNWDWNAYTLEPEMHSEVAYSSVTGLPFISEVRTGQKLRFMWGAGIGIGPDEVAAFEQILQSVGRNDPIIVAADPTDEPTRETGLFRVVADPQPARFMAGSPAGRYELSVDLERVAVK